MSLHFTHRVSASMSLPPSKCYTLVKKSTLKCVVMCVPAGLWSLPRNSCGSSVWSRIFVIMSPTNIWPPYSPDLNHLCRRCCWGDQPAAPQYHWIIVEGCQQDRESNGREREPPNPGMQSLLWLYRGRDRFYWITFLFYWFFFCFCSLYHNLFSVISRALRTSF